MMPWSNVIQQAGWWGRGTKMLGSGRGFDMMGFGGQPLGKKEGCPGLMVLVMVIQPDHGDGLEGLLAC